MNTVYWIRLPEHTDPFSQGYIGVSKNPAKRWYCHKTYGTNKHLNNAINLYGWNTMIKEVILIGSQEYCLYIENQLRPNDAIGWNVTKGGGIPPNCAGRKLGPRSLETKKKISEANKGFKHKPDTQVKINEMLTKAGIKTRFKNGHTPWNKGKSMPASAVEAVRKANIGRKQSEEEKAKRAKSMIGHRVSEFTRERMRQMGLTMPRAMKGKHFPKVQCPHCQKIGGSSAMPRWHFDRCKFKEKE